MHITAHNMTNATPVIYDDPVNVEVTIGNSGAAYVVIDREFNKPVSWFELDAQNGRLEFIMEDGELRNFGVRLLPEINKHLMFATTITLALMNEDELLDAQELPLIVHGS